MEFSDTRFDIFRRFHRAPDCYVQIVISRLFPRSVCTRAGVTRRVARQARAVVLPLTCVLLLVACVSGVTDVSDTNAGGAAPGLGGSSAGGNTGFTTGGS